ncbi:hypothetical protein GQR58_002758 [Nymphon striatum]|nr:hypothetical protein GQR58_002758 [Nymphon striatum]
MHLSLGLLPPIWPTDFVTEFERVIENSTTHVGVYSNFGENKVTFHQISRGIWTRKILDFGLDQCITIKQEDSTKDVSSVGHGYKCIVSDLQGCNVPFASHPYEFMTDFLKTQFLYDRRLDFKTGGEVRGIKVNDFDGCLIYESPTGKEDRFKVKYAFSGDTVVAPSDYNKTAFPVSVTAISNNTKKHQSYYWFDSMKSIYQKYFYIPEGSYCEGYKRKKPFPAINDLLKFRTQVIYDKYEFIDNEEKLTQNEIFSLKFLLKRVDLTVTDNEPLLEGQYVYNPISVIYDMQNRSKDVRDKISLKIYDYDDTKTNILDFDIHTCTDQHSKIYAHIAFHSEKKFNVEDLRNRVEESFIAEVSLVGNIPPLSIQDLQVIYNVSEKQFDVFFSLMDYGQKFRKPDVALKAINASVTSGSFIIEMSTTDTEMVFVAINSSLSYIFPKIDNFAMEMDEAVKLNKVETTTKTPNKEKDEHYSSGYIPPSPPLSFIIKFREISVTDNTTIHGVIQFDVAHNVPGQFLKAALDNLNFHSETEDGGNVDATTNIIYQYSSGEETAAGLC